VKGCGRVVRLVVESPAKTEVAMSGQLVLAVSEEDVVAPAAVWETLPLVVQRLVTVRMARLLGEWLGEEARDERRAEDH
jgi:hypothetical protein